MTLDLKELRTEAEFADRSMIRGSAAKTWNNGRLHPRQVLALLDLVKELREAAVEHGLHPRECRAWLGTSNFTDAEHCSCGLSTAIEKARGA